jgi:hypothetical protein
MRTAQLDGEILTSPVSIAPNLQAGVPVGGGWITCGYSRNAGDFTRTRYRWEIIFPDGSDCSGDDMQSGSQGGNLTQGLASLLSFLGAAAESRQYRERVGSALFEDSNEAIFPTNVVDFVCQHSDEIGALAYEIENPE